MFAAPAVRATHVVGADMTYTCRQGNNGQNIYTVRLDLYQDCESGEPTAIADDVPAFFAVYTGTGSTSGGTRVFLDTSIQYSQQIRVPTNFNNACVNNPPVTCLQRTTFIREISLPPNSVGYRVVYQRCCRNGSVTNINNPGETGATYLVEIPPSASSATCINQSAVFRNFPPQIICINNPLVYDHSATDADGDSLTYEFCTALKGGMATAPKPIPPPPPYDPVDYRNPYTSSNPIAGFPQIQINPTTGQITGTPNLVGRYVVTVCCHEWRNGVRINTTKREFQFVVTACSKAVVADIPQYSTEFNTYVVECNDFTVAFDNNSRGANTGGGSPWFWDFGVPGTNTDVSTDFEPVFTYPDTGIYTVKLVVNRGSTCPDSIERLVKIFPTLRTDYGITGLYCPNTELTFSDSTFSTYTPILYYNWSFGDGATATGPVVTHRYETGGDYLATLITKNIKGCLDTASKMLDIERFMPFAGNDTIIVQNERIQFRARGGQDYTWTPGLYLSNATISNPIGHFTDLGTFGYNVHIRSARGCEGDDSIKIRVVAQPSIFVPSAFSPNGDGRNDLLRPIAIGFARINFFRVYNRWGEQVFSSVAFGEGVAGEGWDGTVRGTPADMGTYFWVLSLTNRFGEEEMRKGDATLLR
jgi:gliding motility-associated-like protein